MDNPNVAPPAPEQDPSRHEAVVDDAAMARAKVHNTYGEELAGQVEAGKEPSKALCDFRADLSAKLKKVTIARDDNEATVNQKLNVVLTPLLANMPAAVKDVLKSRKSPQHILTTQTDKLYVDVVLMNDESGQAAVKTYDKAKKDAMKNVGDVVDGETWLDFKATSMPQILGLSGDVDTCGAAVRKMFDDYNAKRSMTDAVPKGLSENHLATIVIGRENYDIWVGATKIIFKNYTGTRKEF